jgi:hypothetical protein
MATDSTELTFVRCPHCRSLVPAMSKVCRMCGEPLDNEAKVDESDQRKSNRIRQRTMSRGNDELSATAARIREELAVPPAVAGTAPEALASEAPEVETAEAVKAGPAEINIEDPLGAYIEEIEAVDEAPEPREEFGSASHDADFESDPNAESQKLEAESEFEASAPQAENAIPEEDWQASGEQGHSEKVGSNGVSHVSEISTPRHQSSGIVNPVADKSATNPSAYKAATASSALVSAQPSEIAVRPRVVVESGARKVGKPGGLSFSRDKEASVIATEQAVPFAVEDAPTARPAAAPRVPKVAAATPVAAPRSFIAEEPEALHVDQVAAEDFEDQQEQEIEAKHLQARPPPARVEVRKPSAVVPQQAQEVTGRLFGWLVSYVNPKGDAVELREGKFFVSRTSLKASDLILDDESVSTPHAMVSVSSSDGLRVQDLMSERGVFVRPQAGDSYQRVGDVTELQHGDWLRIGDVEFLVSLIAHVGVE